MNGRSRGFGRAAVFVALCLVLALLPGAARATVPQGFTESVLTSALTDPTAMEFAPDGRLFVSEQAGKLRIVKNGALLATPFVTLGNVDNQSERGLIGIAFDPDFATNKFVYVFYTSTVGGVHNQVSRFTANGDVAVAGSEQVIVRFPNLQFLVHNSGAIHFGPDGKLYVAHGDNASPAKAQLLDNHQGKIHRFNRDGTIPADNPFFTTAGATKSIWAYGLRNPFTFAFQPGTGRMYINDVGQHTWEEINEGVAGANYGWPTTEGPTDDPRFRGPIYAYQHDLTAPGAVTGCSIDGGAFYNPEVVRFPAAYVGKYLFGDFCGKWVRPLDTTTHQPADFAFALGFVVDVKVSNDGHVFVLSRQPGTLRRISFDAAQAPTITSQPAAQRVAAGQPATFAVSAAGTPPLSYQWQRNGTNIAGATSPTFTIPNTTLADNGAQFRVRVTNSVGSVTSASALLTVLDDTPPVAAITTPGSGSTYQGGDVIAYSGTGTDAEDGNLPPGAFTWEVGFHHDEHVHPHVPPTSGSASGSFLIPDVGETSDNVFYRIHLKVTDSEGISHSVFRDVLPKKATVRLDTFPSGLDLTLDGQPMSTPFSFTGVVGMRRELGAPSPQSAFGKFWSFGSWSDGGAATHMVTTPPADGAFTATFEETTGVVFVASASAGVDRGEKVVSVPRPPGTSPGDVMVASVVVNDDDMAVSAPPGWNLLRENSVRDALRQVVFTRVATATEPGAYAFSVADFRRLAAGISTYRGVDTAQPVDVHGAVVDTSPDSAVDAPSLVTTVDGAMLVHLAAVNAEATLTSLGTTERWEAHSYNTTAARDALASSSDAVMGPAGPTGSRTVNATNPGVHIGTLIALRPAGSTPPPAGVVFVASASAGVDRGEKVVSVPRPPGTLPGDVMVASVVVNDDDMAVSAPAGWNLVRQDAIPDRLRQVVFTRVATATEPGAYAFAVADFRRLAAGISTYRGVDTAQPVDVHGAVVDTSPDSAVDAPSLVTTVDGTMLVHLAAVNAEATLTSLGTTERWEAHSYNTTAARDALASSSDAVMGPAGPTGSRTVNATNPGVHIGTLIALRPAG